MPLVPTTYKPEEDIAVALIARVSSLVDGSGAQARNCFASPRQSFSTTPGLLSTLPDLCVFVEIDGGVDGKRLRGNVQGVTDERRPQFKVRVRSNAPGVPTAYPDGLSLAREVFEALDKNPPSSSYCESVCFNSYPSYIGQDDDGHHEWLITGEVWVDVVVS